MLRRSIAALPNPSRRASVKPHRNALTENTGANFPCSGRSLRSTVSGQFAPIRTALSPIRQQESSTPGEHCLELLLAQLGQALGE